MLGINQRRWWLGRQACFFVSILWRFKCYGRSSRRPGQAEKCVRLWSHPKYKPFLLHRLYWFCQFTTYIHLQSNLLNHQTPPRSQGLRWELHTFGTVYHRLPNASKGKGTKIYPAVPWADEQSRVWEHGWSATSSHVPDHPRLRQHHDFRDVELWFLPTHPRSSPTIQNTHTYI